MALTLQLIRKDSTSEELTQLQAKIDQQSGKIDSMQCTLEWLADIVSGLPSNPEDTLLAESIAECAADSAKCPLDSALVKIGLKEYNEALLLLDRAMIATIGDSEEVAKIHLYRGIILGCLGRHEEAVASCDTAIGYKRDLPAAWNYRGVALRHLGRHEEAVASYDTVLAYKRDDSLAWSNRGVALHHLGRYEEAVASCDTAITYKRDFPLAWNNRGASLGPLGRHQEAVASYDTAIGYKRDFPLAWYNRGTSLDHLGRHQEAVASYDTAIGYKRDFPLAWYNRGAALRHLGRYRDAFDSYLTALGYQWAAAHAALKVFLLLVYLVGLAGTARSTVANAMLLLKSRTGRMWRVRLVILSGLLSAVLILVILQMIVWTVRQ